MNVFYCTFGILSHHLHQYLFLAVVCFAGSQIVRWWCSFAEMVLRSWWTHLDEICHYSCLFSICSLPFLHRTSSPVLLYDFLCELCLVYANTAQPSCAGTKRQVLGEGCNSHLTATTNHSCVLMEVSCRSHNSGSEFVPLIPAVDIIIILKTQAASGFALIKKLKLCVGYDLTKIRTRTLSVGTWTGFSVNLQQQRREREMRRQQEREQRRREQEEKRRIEEMERRRKEEEERRRAEEEKRRADREQVRARITER